MAGNALKAMVSFFTIWQQDITQEDMDAMDSEFDLAPLVGALIGLVVFIEAIVLILLSRHGILSSSLFAAATILATVYFGSRFLHFDGLADFGDGSIVAGTQADHVRALKDTLIGAGGLGVALIVTLLNFSLYSAAFAFLIILAPVTEVLAKNAQVVTACYGLPSNGMAGRQVEQTNGRSMAMSCEITIVLIVVFAVAGMLVTNWIVDYKWIYPLDAITVVVLGMIASIVSAYLMARRANRVFGMVNGDILGASHEIARFASMLVMVIAFGLVV